MRHAWTWIGCLALLFVGCTEFRPVGGRKQCDDATGCTVTLKEAGGVCTVVPGILIIDPGATVTFVAELSPNTTAVTITPKKASTRPLHFQHGPPTEIRRGDKFDTGPVTAVGRGRYAYTATFEGSSGCAPVDPVICINMCY